MLDQVLVARQTRHAHRTGDALIDRSQPPGARAAHADARRADATLVHLRPRTQVIQRDLIVAHEHAPQGSAHPQVPLEQRIVLFTYRFGAARWAHPRTSTVPTRIWREHDIALLGERLAQGLH